ncbi:YkvA family protein [Azotosporobacter soli]|uniref:YkvA family protein n=1 Tax=Azotosporobacter soli TaxID=3055040 RepID=UPI0031FF0814
MENSNHHQTPNSVWNSFKQQLKNLKGEVYILYLALRDPRTPLLAKLVTAVVVGYALSPIDLIPDFIPVIGYLDDFIVIPLGVWLALKLIPQAIITDCREYARNHSPGNKPKNWLVGGIFILIWLAAILYIVRLFY